MSWPDCTGRRVVSDFLIDAVGRSTAAAIQAGIARAVADGIEAAGPGISRELRKLEREIRKEGLSSDVRLRIHQQQARNAQRTILGSYDSSLGKNRTSPVGYRADDTGINKRYSGGALRRALADPAFVGATADSVLIANTSLLNRRAKQWRRLNFGAGGVGGGSAPPTQIKARGPDGRPVVLGSIGLNEGPSPGFRIPPGVWMEGAFYPYGSMVRPSRFETDSEGNLRRKPGFRVQTARQTRGVKNRNFIDAGLRTVAGGAVGHARSGAGAGGGSLVQMYADEVLGAAKAKALGLTAPRVRKR